MPSEDLTPRHLRFFTPKEANDLLPQLIGLATAASEGARRYRELVIQMRNEENLSAVAREAAEAQAREIREEVRIVVMEIADHGVEVKGLNPALLEFPAQRHGHDVFISWKESESEVTHWHPTHVGFDEREMIVDPDDGCWEWCN